MKTTKVEYVHQWFRKHQYEWSSGCVFETEAEAIAWLARDRDGSPRGERIIQRTTTITEKVIK